MSAPEGGLNETAHNVNKLVYIVLQFVNEHLERIIFKITFNGFQNSFFIRESFFELFFETRISLWIIFSGMIGFAF